MATDTIPSTEVGADLSSIAALYRRDGFVHVPGVLSPDEVSRFGAAVDHAVATRKQWDTRSLSEKTLYEQSFIQCQYLWEDFPKVRGLTFHAAIGQLAAALIGAPCVRLWHDQALYKEAGGRETEAHQDHPYWPIAELDTVTAWIPLMAVDAETGCMGYTPGSHRGDAQFVDIFTTPGAGEALEARQTARPTFVACQAGDVIFHHGLTVHRAKPNHSSLTRRVYTAIYFADGSTRGGDRPHPSVDREGIGVGQVIAGRATPVAWPHDGINALDLAPWPGMNDERRARQLRLGVIPSVAR